MSRKPTYEELEESLQRFKDIEQELLETKAKLQDQVMLWELLFEQSRDGIVILDENGLVYSANTQYADMLGYSMEEVYQLHVWDWDLNFTKEQLQKMLKTVDAKGDHFETLHRRKDGGAITVELSTSGTVYKGQKLIFCISRDVTERNRMKKALQESEEKYHELSIIDGLTGLYNSRHFYNQIEIETDRSVRYGGPLTLMFLDLDNFKQFNDAYGHIDGDQVLARLGHIIKGCLRRTDSAFRYGGEEFAVLMPVTTCAEGTLTAERIRRKVKNEAFYPVPGEEVHITVSIGVLEYKHGMDIKSLVRQADKLMYKAKKEGKDRTCTATS